MPASEPAAPGFIVRHLRCPACRQTGAARSRRTSRWERLLSRAYLYPFRCVKCHHRFLAFSLRQWKKRPEQDSARPTEVLEL
jgi:hypothetical protein